MSLRISSLLLVTALTVQFAAARAWAQPPGPAQTAAPRVPVIFDKPTSETLPMSLDALLADPAATDPDLRWLNEQRAALARKDPNLDDFENVAKAMESKGAYYSAVEILWFAEKGVTKPESHQLLNE